MKTLTKQQIIKRLQEEETKLWYDLVVYDYNHSPRGDKNNIDDYEMNDLERNNLLGKWSGIYDLLKEMGISTIINEEAFELNMRLSRERKVNK